ncbi:hypothetical protein Q3G72_011139 [Acer saccharum]|nr:hypothetical protein Q3G72_011139 [Acer saccharum]
MSVDVCGVNPTHTTMVCVLSTSSQLGVLESGACVHGYIEKTIYMPENDLFVGTGLVDMYSKSGCLDSALSIFRCMGDKNVLTWTAKVTGLAIHGRGKEAIRFLDLMRVCGVKPNAVTFTSLFSACCHAGLVEEGLALKRSIQIHHGELLSACNVHGDVVPGEKARKILLQLQPESISDDLTGTSEDYVALSNVYASEGRWLEVESLRKEMKIKKIETEPGCSLVQTTKIKLLRWV